MISRQEEAEDGYQRQREYRRQREKEEAADTFEGGSLRQILKWELSR